MEQISEELSLENEFQKETIGFTRKRALILVAASAVVIALVIAAALLLPQKPTMPVFSEIMTSNHAAFDHPEYGTVDWVEIYNPSDADIDLSGYGFSNEIKRTFRYTFPEGTVLKSGGYLLLYCTGGTEQSDADPYCTGFNLSAKGEDLYLVNPNNVEADEAHVPALEADTAYAKTGSGEFAVTTVPTPGEANRFE